MKHQPSQKRIKKENIPTLIIGIFLVVAAIKAIAIRFPATPEGDELFYYREVTRLGDIGLVDSLIRGTSFLFTSIAWLINLIIGNILISTRLTSLIPAFFIIGSLWKVASLWGISTQIKKLMTLTLLAFVFDYTRSPFMFGTNDALLFAAIAEATYHLCLFIKNGNYRNLLTSAALFGIGFWIREITLMYIAPLFVTGLLYVLFYSKRVIQKRVIDTISFSAILLAVAITPHLPALYSRGEFGFEDKNYMGNWREREFLTQLKREPSGSIFSYKQVDWEEVERYKESENIPKLPATRWEIAKSDPKMVVDAFASNLLIRSSYLFLLRNGLFFFLFLSAILMHKTLAKTPISPQWVLIVSIIVGYTLEISAITIHRIEIRWLTLPTMFVALAGAYVLQLLQISNPKLFKALLTIQYIFIGVSTIAIIF